MNLQTTVRAGQLSDAEAGAAAGDLVYVYYTDSSKGIEPADKGDATVIIKKTDYINKANQVFNDREAYTLLPDDPNKKQAASVKTKITELTRLKFISPDDSRFMNLSDPVLHIHMASQGAGVPVRGGEFSCGRLLLVPNSHLCLLEVGFFQRPHPGPADKGDATVIIKKTDYINKANQVFNDREAYTPLPDDPNKMQAASVKTKITELTRLKFITPDDSRFMNLSDPVVNAPVAASYWYPTLTSASSKLGSSSGHTLGNRNDRRAKPGEGLRCWVCLDTRYV
ncbi:unnamed protein product [Schistocephalus solidus]|uniref:LTD domain-containing protein n=1 Tax=Schistocephalus solidus TaxID=70667 RepID=A0A183T906_SCHSO|nr:unnamed protein product [Schistocephalus solidus]